MNNMKIKIMKYVEEKMLKGEKHEKNDNVKELKRMETVIGLKQILVLPNE